MQIEITIKKLDSGKFRIDLSSDTCLATSWKGFKNAMLEFKEVDKKTLILGSTIFYDNIEDAEFVAREYLKSKNAVKIKKIKV